MGGLRPLSDVDIAVYLAESLFLSEKMAKFRNIVVRHYDKVDAEIVVGILKKDLKDFMDYKVSLRALCLRGETS